MEEHGVPSRAVRVTSAAADVDALELEGEFDLASVQEIHELAAGVLRNGKHLVVDLSRATFVDSSVVNALVRAHEAAEEAGRRVVLQLATESAVERVVELSAVEQVLERAPSRAEAIELLRRGDA